MLTRSFTLLTLLSLAAPAARAQTDSVPHNAGNLVHAGGYVVVHDDGSAVQAFSALTQEFTGIGSTGSTIIEVGDFTAMLLNGSNTITAYSARTNVAAVLPLTALEAVNFVEVEDDVLFVVSTTLGGELRLHAFSAQLSTWETLSLGTGVHFSNLDWATSRFVIGVRHDQGGLHTLSCFSARQGAWVQITNLVDADDLVADGNIFAANVTDNFGPRVYAFSGVHGVGALSPETVSSIYLTVSHNLAYTRAFDLVNSWMATAFSAYDGVWVTSTRARALTETAGVYMRDNFVGLRDGPLVNSPRWEIIGARPHQHWADLQVSTGEISTSEDSLVLRQFSGSTLQAFSGLANGTWIAQSAPTPYTGTTDKDHLNAVIDGDSSIQMFSPARAAWAAPLTEPSGGSLAMVNHGDAVCVVNLTNSLGDESLRGYNVRDNNWVTGPNINGTMDTVTGGSVANVHVDTGFSFPSYFYNSRTHSFDTRGAFQSASLTAGRNLVFQEESLLIWAYSHQRGDHGFLTNRFGQSQGPFSLGPVVEENVAWVVDGAGELVAYSSTHDIQSIFQYPDGTEYYAFAEAADPVSPTPLRISSRVMPGFTRTYLGSNRLALPVALPPALFVGQLWIATPYFINQTVNFGNLAFAEVPLPNFVPVNFPFWLQNVCLPVPFQPIPFIAGDDVEVFWAF